MPPSRNPRHHLRLRDCKQEWVERREVRDAFLMQNRTLIARFVNKTQRTVRSMLHVALRMREHFGTQKLSSIHKDDPRWATFFPLDPWLERVLLAVFEHQFHCFVLHECREPLPGLHEVAALRAKEDAAIFAQQRVALATMRYFQKRGLTGLKVGEASVKHGDAFLRFCYFNAHSNTFHFKGKRRELFVPNVLWVYVLLEKRLRTYIPFIATIVDFVGTHEHVCSGFNRPRFFA